MIKIYPSLIAGDLLHLAEQIKQLEPYCDGFHIDIMDHHFVPNLTWGPDFVNAIRRVTKLPLWVHLMVDNPAPYLPTMQLQKDDIVSLHYEGQPYAAIIHQLELIQKHGQRASLAMSPKTPIASLSPILQKVQLEQVLLMGVKPGFSGQKFLPETMQRLDELVTLRAGMNAEFAIALDGGINATNLPALIKHGADEIAIGSGIFATQDPIETLQKLRKI